MCFELKFLTCHTQEGDEFLDPIVTGDETWVFHHTPELTQQSLQWRHTHDVVKGQAADFYDLGIQKLVPRLNKGFDNAGEYVEK
jgi:hypothetical protein